MIEYNHISPEQKAWIDEASNCFPSADDFDSARCAELPEELDCLMLSIKEDPEFDDKFDEWTDYIESNYLRLPLEQSCAEGVLLPKEVIYQRMQSCPDLLMTSFGKLLNECPPHVLARLALENFFAVRIDRMSREGKNDWSPKLFQLDLDK